MVISNDQLAQREAQWFMNIETLQSQMLECLAESAWCCLENNGCCMTVQQYYMFPEVLRKFLPIEAYPINGHTKTFMALRYTPKDMIRRLQVEKPLPQMFMEYGYVETKRQFIEYTKNLCRAELGCAKYGGTCV